MVTAISTTAPSQPVAPTTRTSAPRHAQPASKPKDTDNDGDSVQISQAAQAALAALQESTETPAQTATEAGKGDPQAQKLLQQQAAAKQKAE